MAKRKGPAGTVTVRAFYRGGEVDGRIFKERTIPAATLGEKVDELLRTGAYSSVTAELHGGARSRWVRRHRVVIGKLRGNRVAVDCPYCGRENVARLVAGGSVSYREGTCIHFEGAGEPRLGGEIEWMYFGTVVKKK